MATTRQQFEQPFTQVGAPSTGNQLEICSSIARSNDA
jgi:hypothetical protein